MFVFAPTEQAGPNPPGEVYDLQKDIDDKFPTPVHYASFVIEAKNGDVLTQQVLYELDQNIKANVAVINFELPKAKSECKILKPENTKELIDLLRNEAKVL